MACKCPVCKKAASGTDGLVTHIVNSHDESHEKWLESYCESNGVDFARMVLEQINGNKNAAKPLTAPVKRDFCS